MNLITCRDIYGKMVTLPAEKFKPRPSVYALLENKGRILLVKNISNGKYWLPGGGVEVGEDFEFALRREVEEETGLKNITIQNKITDFQNYFYYNPADIAMDSQLYFYHCTTTEDNLKTNEEINDDESFDPAGFSPSDITVEMFNDLGEKIMEIINKIFPS